MIGATWPIHGQGSGVGTEPHKLLRQRSTFCIAVTPEAMHSTLPCRSPRLRARAGLRCTHLFGNIYVGASRCAGDQGPLPSLYAQQVSRAALRNVFKFTIGSQAEGGSEWCQARYGYCARQCEFPLCRCAGWPASLPHCIGRILYPPATL